jgi:hypothetical protein
MSTRESLLLLIEQMPEDNLSPLLQLAQSLQTEDASGNLRSIDLKAMLALPRDRRNQLLTLQSNLISSHLQPGSEAMEWVEDYVEDDQWEQLVRPK